ncbi:hypothetical protein F5J12DRAFT_853962 [Pisolithus orientalis]|uniref:uncharacterized protein n=1 Tax=Pisolithus orientalis TaxID=936130 RepID=UPI0022248485|nr:uncharacterized protein F5J12DRAFT_853962 [Pisolithus orientalis]KAI5996497.1 hypothetical protein F5J12DRAFT_853962 [Pisolithus orientalis]
MLFHTVTELDAAAVGGSTAMEYYFRVASLSIAFYDYFLTLPNEYRFYRSQPHILQMSQACILFILIRYVSIVSMVVSNYGAFSTSFTLESCRHYYYVSPIFKVLQTMVSQAIVGFRTFNISRRNENVRNFLVVYYIIAVVVSHSENACISGTSSGSSASWLFYLVAICYDLVTLGISTVQFTVGSSFHQLIQVMLYDGLIFFVALTAVNVLNLILYRGTNVVAQVTCFQSIHRPSLGYAVIWIMSQRILIHLREVAAEIEGGSQSINILTRHLRREQDVELPSRLQFKPPKGKVDQRSRADDQRLGVQITVRQTVTVDYPPDEELGLPHKET